MVAVAEAAARELSFAFARVHAGALLCEHATHVMLAAMGSDVGADAGVDAEVARRWAVEHFPAGLVRCGARRCCLRYL